MSKAAAVPRRSERTMEKMKPALASFSKVILVEIMALEVAVIEAGGVFVDFLFLAVVVVVAAAAAVVAVRVEEEGEEEEEEEEVD